MLEFIPSSHPPSRRSTILCCRIQSKGEQRTRFGMNNVLIANNHERVSTGHSVYSGSPQRCNDRRRATQKQPTASTVLQSFFLPERPEGSQKRPRLGNRKHNFVSSSGCLALNYNLDKLEILKGRIIRKILTYGYLQNNNEIYQNIKNIIEGVRKRVVFFKHLHRIDDIYIE